MQTVINWREYPKEKPPLNITVMVHHKNSIGTDRIIKPLFGKERWKNSYCCKVVTHFAHPEDVVTTPSEPKGE